MSDRTDNNVPPPVLSYASPPPPRRGGGDGSRARWFAVSAFASTFMILVGYVALEDKGQLGPPSQLLFAGIAIPAVIAAMGTAIVMWTLSVRNSFLGQGGVTRGVVAFAIAGAGYPIAILVLWRMVVLIDVHKRLLPLQLLAWVGCAIVAGWFLVRKEKRAT